MLSGVTPPRGDDHRIMESVAVTITTWTAVLVYLILPDIITIYHLYNINTLPPGKGWFLYFSLWEFENLVVMGLIIMECLSVVDLLFLIPRRLLLRPFYDFITNVYFHDELDEKQHTVTLL